MLVNLGANTSDYGFEEMRAVLARVEKALVQRALAPHPASRFAKHIQRLKQATSGNDVPIEGALIAVRTLQQAAFDLRILDLVFAELSGSEWRPLLERMLGGNDVPWSDKDDGPRNAEFELYLASVLRQAGYKVHAEEPDLRFVHQGWTIGVAAKRLGSPKKLIERLKEGVRQIERAQIPGFVKIDASACCLKRQEVVVVDNVLDAQGSFDLKMLELQRTATDELIRSPSPLVVGIMLTSFVPCISGPKMDCLYTVLGGRYWGTSIPSTDPRAKNVERITRQISKVPII